MSLTRRGGPLSASPRGILDRPGPSLLLEPHDRLLRAEVGDTELLRTTRACLLHERGKPPRPYVPIDDFARDLLERSDHVSRCPRKGSASYWSIRAPDGLRENCVWTYEAPTAEAAHVAGLASLYWDAADEWFEEDERLVGYFRDPYHRVDVRRSHRAFRLLYEGRLICDSRSPVLVFETGHPTRAYVAPHEVRTPIQFSATTALDPYKGVARYASIPGGIECAWTYWDPLPEAKPLRGLLSFHGAGMIGTLDGEPLEMALEPPPRFRL
jgi:uncharacterized protein (DUF427 family)